MKSSDNTPSIIHAIRILHKDLYCISNKLSKRDKLGIHATVELLCLEMLMLAIESAFRSTQTKKSALEILRVKIEAMKHLIRTEKELLLIEEKNYLHLEEELIKISKMTSGWITFVMQKDLPE